MAKPYATPALVPSDLPHQITFAIRRSRERGAIEQLHVASLNDALDCLAEQPGFGYRLRCDPQGSDILDCWAQPTAEGEVAWRLTLVKRNGGGQS